MEKPTIIAQKNAPDSTDKTSKFLIALFIPLFSFSFFLPTFANSGYILICTLVFLGISIFWGIFSYIKIMTGNNFSFIFITEKVTDISENIHHHQKFFCDTQRENEAKRFLMHYYMYRIIVIYFLIDLFIIFCGVLGFEVISELYKWGNSKTLIYFGGGVCVPTFFFILKIIQIRKKYLFEQKNFLFLSQGRQKYTIRKYQDSYFVFDKK